MSLSHEHVGPKILGKIKTYVLTRAELLFTLCYEIPCTADMYDVTTCPIRETITKLHTGWSRYRSGLA